MFCVTRQAVGKWVKGYRKGGVSALDAKKQGHPPGELLSEEQKQQIVDRLSEIHLINMDYPIRCGPVVLWVN